MDEIAKFTPNLARYESLMDVIRNQLADARADTDTDTYADHEDGAAT